MSDAINGLEDKLKQLKAINQALAEESLSMQEMLDKYKEGVALYAACAEIIQKAEEEVRALGFNDSVAEEG